MTRELRHSSRDVSTQHTRELPSNDVGAETAPAAMRRASDGDALRAGIVVVAASRLICDVLAATVERRFTVLGTGSTLREAEKALTQHQPQLSLLAVDPPLPDAGFQDTCHQLIESYPMTYALLVFRNQRAEDFILAYQQGARGLFDMTISPDELISGLERLADGNVVIQPEILRHMMQALTRADEDAGPDYQSLTPTQTQMLALLSEGYTSKEIARLMNVTTASVNHNIERAAQRLGAQHRAEAVARALRLGIIK